MGVKIISEKNTDNKNIRRDTRTGERSLQITLILTKTGTKNKLEICLHNLIKNNIFAAEKCGVPQKISENHGI